MKTKKTLVLAAIIVLMAVVLAGGCKQKMEKPAAPEPNKVAAAEVEQTTCPVMAGKVDKNVFTVYQGKKVYFCCTMCKAQFEKDPQKYIAKLPQFAK